MISVFLQLGATSEQVYLSLESQRLQATFDELLSHKPHLATILSRPDVMSPADKTELETFEEDFQAEIKISGDLCINFYWPDGTYLGEAGNDPSCRPIEPGVIAATAGSGRGELLEDIPQKDAWTVVTAVTIGDSGQAVIAAVAKSAAKIDSDIDQSFRLWALLALAGFLAATLLGWLLVRAAQKRIDDQVTELIRLRTEISHYLSPATVRAVARTKGRDIQSERSIKTLLFLDIRDFSGYAETARLDVIVTFVSEIVSLSASIIAAHGGDVNKVIGDGLLASFDGDARQARAIAAALDILRGIGSGDFPRGIGIGIHDGEMISATVGRGQRRDHTVLGRVVNQTSRLCSLAKAGEIVASIDVVGHGGEFESLFGPEQTATLKGHAADMLIRKYKPDGHESTRPGN